MISTKIVIFIITVVANTNCLHNNSHQYTYLVQILKSKNNLFRNLHENAQKTVNALFDSLDLIEDFSKEPKIKLLVTMHYDLNNMAEKNFEMYDLLKKASAVKLNNTAIKISQLDEMVMEILNKRTSDTLLGTPANQSLVMEFHKRKEFSDDVAERIKKRSIGHSFKKAESKTSDTQDRDESDLMVWEPEPESNVESYNNFTSNRRIYGGKKSRIISYPFIVSIHILNDFTCAGNIISKDLIITAASCLQLHYNNRFFREHPKTTFVRVGSDWTARRGEMIPVLEMYFHPQYDPKTLNHNLAIIRLTRTLNFKRHRKTKIRRILIDRGDGNLPSNTNQIKILGWGATVGNQVVNMFQKLTIATLDIYGIRGCQEIYSKEYVTENHFCAGYMSKGTGACNRDVGGPGFTDNFLIGIISFGSPVCGTVDSPTVFTRVGHYIDWIDRIMKLRPVTYGAPITQTPANKVIIYYNTITTTKIPHIIPYSTNSLYLRAKEMKGIKMNPTTVSTLTGADIIYAMDDDIDDVAEDELQDIEYDDHYITNTEKQQNISLHSLVNETNLTGGNYTVQNTTTVVNISTLPVRFSTISTNELNLKDDDNVTEKRRSIDSGNDGDEYYYVSNYENLKKENSGTPGLLTKVKT